jgi:hypothetical protein
MRVSRWLPLIAVAALLAAGALAAARSTPELVKVLPTPAVQTAEPEAAPTDAPDRNADPPFADGGDSWSLPSWVGTAVAVFCLLVVAVVVGLLVWHVMRDRMRVRSAPLVVEAARTPPVGAADEVVAALDAGLSDLSDQDSDPRLAVIACWVRLEEVAAAVGTPRHPGDTPTDLVGRVLAAHRVSGPVLDDFAGVYREARYATHPVGERTRADAIRALGLLRTELTGVVVR